jgi:hypothetical protein
LFLIFRDYSQPESSGGAGGSADSRRPADHVWILTGSIGAVGAAMRLLGAVSPDRSLAFILALRVTNDGLPLISRLLARTTPFLVHVAGLERALYPRDVLVLPVDGVSPEPGSRGGVMSRAIDDVLGAIAERYRDKSGVIVLSGIGTEGIKGCGMITRYGGRLWVQDPASCEHGSLPAAIQEACKVTFAASPEQLAGQLMALIPSSEPP